MSETRDYGTKFRDELLNGELFYTLREAYRLRRKLIMLEYKGRPLSASISSLARRRPMPSLTNAASLGQRISRSLHSTAARRMISEGVSKCCRCRPMVQRLFFRDRYSFVFASSLTIERVRCHMVTRNSSLGAVPGGRRGRNG